MIVHSSARHRAVNLAIIAFSPTILICTGEPSSCQDQPKAPPPAAPTAASGSAVSKSPNVKSGEIAVLDTAADLLTLRERSGKTSVYVLSAKTHYNRNKRAAQLSDFKVGSSVVLHFRKSRSDGALLVSELDDAVSWMWLAAMRKTTTAAIVKLITDDTLSVTIGPENIPLDYTISEKTRWEKGGKEVDSTAFKPAERVFVVPRSLPSGSIMARAVADTTAGAAQEKERMAASVHGTILKVEMAAHKLTVKTAAADTRNLAFTDETEVVLAGKNVPLATLKTGLHISARVRHEPGGDEEAWRITIETSRRPSTAKKTPATSAGAARPTGVIKPN